MAVMILVHEYIGKTYTSAQLLNGTYRIRLHGLIFPHFSRAGRADIELFALTVDQRYHSSRKARLGVCG
jgi:hypothetical protein